MLNICSQIFVALVLMIMTGHLAILIWRYLIWPMQKKMSEFVCITLRIVCLFYVVPIGFILIKLFKRNGYLQGNHMWQMNFRVTNIMGTAILMFLVVWIGFIVFKSSKRNLSKRQIISGDIPEENKIAVEEFIRAKKHLKIYGPVHIYRNDIIRGPRIQGLFCSRIILPFKNYTKEQLRVIYFHELVHYKHHDIFYKYCSVATSSLTYIMKELSIYRNKMLDELCEYQCDCSAIAALNDEMTEKDYFTHILESMENVSESGKEEQLFSKLSGNSVQLQRRVAYIKRYEKPKQKKKRLILFLTLVFVIIIMIISYIAGYGFSILSDCIYQRTERVEVREKQDGLLVMTIDGNSDELSDENLSVENDEEYIVHNQIDTFNETWSVETDEYILSDSVFLKSGQCISVGGIIIPNTEVCQIGIKHADNEEIVYVQQSKAVFRNDYQILEDGVYQLFMYNQGEKTITATIHITYD